MKIFQLIKKIWNNLFETTDEIISIEFIGNKDVIDIEVSGDHLFYCNKLLTHNSANGYAGENIDMSSVSESSCISATADAMVAIFGLDGDKEAGIKRLKILKNRLGKGVEQWTQLRENPESLRMTDGEDDSPINDDILGGVEDASHVSIKENIKDNPQKSQVDSTIEDL